MLAGQRQADLALGGSGWRLPGYRGATHRAVYCVVAKPYGG
jgi:hypothetical protein